jgi:hypothetical protein
LMFGCGLKTLTSSAHVSMPILSQTTTVSLLTLGTVCLIETLRERFAALLGHMVLTFLSNVFLYTAIDQLKGMVLGTVPRVLTLSTGSGQVGRDPIHWAYTEDLKHR